MTDASSRGPPREGTREHRVWVMRDTLGLVGDPERPKYVPYALRARPPMYRGIAPLAPAGPCPRVSVVEKDTLYAAADLRRASPAARVAVLDMASDRHPGGGYSTGAGAQEEDLCRRTTLVPHLLAASAAGLYPMPPDAMYVVPDVLVLKTARPAYRLLKPENQFSVGVLVAAALRNPSLTPEGRYTDGNRAVMRRKMEVLLAAASASGFDTLVLGAWGCGAFHNPPREVATLFKEVLDAQGAAFKEVVFAIVRDDNLPEFMSVFPTK